MIKQCKCGYIFTVKDIKPPIMNQKQAFGSYDINLLGGRAKYFAKAECKCGREYILWLKPIHQSYEILNISISKDIKEQEISAENMSMKELREIAREKGIKNYIKYTKKELAELIRTA